VGKSIDLGAVSDRVVIAVASAPVGNRTRHLLSENRFAPRFRQCVPPQGKILSYGRNAGIANQRRFREALPVIRISSGLHADDLVHSAGRIIGVFVSRL